MSDIKRYDWVERRGSTDIIFRGMRELSGGRYVSFEDYKYLSDYCDHLVSFSKLPCLPKDLELLREANSALATEVEVGKAKILKMQEAHEESCKLIKYYSGRLKARENELAAIRKIIQ